MVVVVVGRRAAVQQQLLLTNSSPSNSPSTAFHHHEYSEWRIIDAILFVASLSLQPLGLFVAGAKQVFTGQTHTSTHTITFHQDNQLHKSPETEVTGRGILVSKETMMVVWYI